MFIITNKLNSGESGNFFFYLKVNTVYYFMSLSNALIIIISDILFYYSCFETKI